MKIKILISLLIFLFCLEITSADDDAAEEFSKKGIVSYIRGDLEQAVENFEKAYALNKKSEKVKTFYLKSLVELSTQYYGNKEFEKAAPYLKKAYMIAPENKNVKKMYEIVASVVESPEEKTIISAEAEFMPLLSGFRKEQERLVATYLKHEDSLQKLIQKMDDEKINLKILISEREKEARKETRSIIISLISGIMIVGGIIFFTAYIIVKKREKTRIDSLLKHEEKIIGELREAVFNSQKGLKVKAAGKKKRNIVTDIMQEMKASSVLPEKQILVVDDSADARRGLLLYLNAEKYEVQEAESGERAIELIKQNNYNLVLTDLKMQVIDGLGVLKEVKNLHPQTEVIVMTAYGSAESAVEAMKLGAYDYILKPLNMDELELLIKRCLEKQRLAFEVSDLRVKLLEKELSEEKDPKVVIKLLKPFLNDDNNMVRANAAKALYKHSEKLSLDTLTDMLKSPDLQMQLSAVWALGEIDSEKTINILIKKIDGKEPIVARKAAKILKNKNINKETKKKIDRILKNIEFA